LFNIINWAREKDIKVLGLSDTNIDNKEGNWINEKELTNMGYKGFWSKRDIKVKGSGVAIIVNNEWAKHVESVISINPYVIEIKMFFKGITIKIIQLYTAPSDDRTLKTILEYIKNTHVHRDKFRTIIMGDFNAIIDPNLDKQGGTQKSPKPHPIIQSLQSHNFIDTFRELNSNAKKFTWDNKRIGTNNIKTRIDYIWTDINWLYDVVGADIIDANLITGSDHNIAKAQLDTSNIIRNHKKHIRSSRNETRRIFRYNDIPKETWDKYRNEMANAINESHSPSSNWKNITTRLDKAIEEQNSDRPFMNQI